MTSYIRYVGKYLVCGNSFDVTLKEGEPLTCSHCPKLTIYLDELKIEKVEKE